MPTTNDSTEFDESLGRIKETSARTWDILNRPPATADRRRGSTPDDWAALADEVREMITIVKGIRADGERLAARITVLEQTSDAS